MWLLVLTSCGGFSRVTDAKFDRPLVDFESYFAVLWIDILEW